MRAECDARVAQAEKRMRKHFDDKLRELEELRVAVDHLAERLGAPRKSRPEDAEATDATPEAEPKPEAVVSTKTRISYAEAYAQLGGDDVLKEYRKQSEELLKRTGRDVELDKRLAQRLPLDPRERKAYSTRLVYQHFVNSLDELLTKGATVIDGFHAHIKRLGKDTGGDAHCAPIKSKERANAKAQFKYQYKNGIAWYRLTDIVRATLTYDSIEAMYKGLGAVIDNFGKDVLEVNDRYQEPIDPTTTDSYRDIQLVVEYNDFVCELQLNTKLMLAAKDTTGHRMFEIVRELRAAVAEGALDRVDVALKWAGESFGAEHKLSDMLNQEGKGLLHDAAGGGFAGIVHRLLLVGMDANEPDSDGNTPLHLAIASGRARAVWALIDVGQADITAKNKKGQTALLLGYLLLWTHPPESSIRAVMALAKRSGAELVDEAERSIHDALKEKRHNSVELYLMCRNKFGAAEKIERELENFADPDSRDAKSEQPALISACFHGNIAAVKLLLKFKADANIRFEAHLSADSQVHPEGCTPLEAALKCSDRQSSRAIVELLLTEGKVPNPDPDRQLFFTIEMSLLGPSKWCGCAALDKKVYCAPRNRDSILVCDTELERVHKVASSDRAVDLSVLGGWESICESGGRLFCPPYMANSVLVFDPKTEQTKFIEVVEARYVHGEVVDELVFDPKNTDQAIDNFSGEAPLADLGTRWTSAAVFNDKIYCSPGAGSHVLVIDPATDTLSSIDISKIDTRISCDGAVVEGLIDEIGEELDARADESVRKWDGICAYDGKLYCAPSSHDSVLIVDAATNACTLLDTGDHSEGKFAGICELDGKVYCCPSNASYVLVIDPGSAAPGSATLSRIQLGMRREDKWSGIVAFEGMLYCAPCGQSSVLQIDPKNKTHNLLETGESATTIDRWDGICECNGRLYCAPSDMTSILVMTKQEKRIQKQKTHAHVDHGVQIWKTKSLRG